MIIGGRAQKGGQGTHLVTPVFTVAPGTRMAHGGDHLSTSTTVEVRRLSHPDFLIEVEVMAAIPGR